MMENLRLSLTDLSDDMKKLVKQAAEAEGLTDETITNLTAAYVSENELDILTRYFQYNAKDITEKQ